MKQIIIIYSVFDVSRRREIGSWACTMEKQNGVYQVKISNFWKSLGGFSVLNSRGY